MKKTFVIAFIFGFFINCGVQKNEKRIKLTSNYTHTDFKKIAEWKYGFNLENQRFCDIYILDGVPFDKDQIDSVLTKYDKSEIGLISVVDMSETQILSHRNCELLTLIKTKSQPNSEKRKILKEVNEIYNDRVSEIIIIDYQCADCPIMSVNGRLIWNPYERKRIVNELTVSKIEYIANISQSLNTKTFGARGKNGIVEITTE